MLGQTQWEVHFKCVSTFSAIFYDVTACHQMQSLCVSASVSASNKMLNCLYGYTDLHCSQPRDFLWSRTKFKWVMKYVDFLLQIISVSIQCTLTWQCAGNKKTLVPLIKDLLDTRKTIYQHIVLHPGLWSSINWLWKRYTLAHAVSVSTLCATIYC